MLLQTVGQQAGQQPESPLCLKLSLRTVGSADGLVLDHVVRFLSGDFTLQPSPESKAGSQETLHSLTECLVLFQAT